MVGPLNLSVQPSVRCATAVLDGEGWRRLTPKIAGVAATLMLATSLAPVDGARAYEANEQLEVNVVAAGAMQCLDTDDGDADGCEGAFALQPEISLKPWKGGEFFAKAGFAEGNSLGNVTPFVLSAWAADLEDDLEDINGRSRDNLLTAWFKQSIEFNDNASLSGTGGIIDSTDYLDDNAFANDEYGQFMNEVFVNAPTANLPSYDYGGVAELDVGPVSLRAVTMNVGENDDGNEFNFYGGQIALATKNHLGEGNYRIVVTGTDAEFFDPTGTSLESLLALTFSADQQLGENVGVFLRFGWQDNEALVTFDALYSGGVELQGAMWGRERDAIGVAFAHLEGGNDEVADSQVFEAYYKLGIREHFALTADLQVLSDNVRGGGGPDGTIFSLRGTAEF